MPMTIRIASSLLGTASAVLAFLAVPAQAQYGQCATSLTVDVNYVSVTAGGVQTISLFSTGGLPFLAGREFTILGSFSGTTPSDPWLGYGGLFLAPDRYLRQSYLGMSPMIPGGFPHAPGGHKLYTDAQGRATQLIVVPPMAFTSYIGRTVRHGVFMDHPLTLVPYCGSNTVTLTFTP